MTTSDCEFVFGDVLSERIRLVCAEKDVVAAVAFWGAEAKSQLFPHWGTRKIKLVCDISMGCNSQSSLASLGAPANPNLRVLDGLHAKVFWSEAGAVVSSANASRNGVGFSGAAAKNLEAGVFYAPGTKGWEDAKSFAEDCFAKGAVIDERQLARAPDIACDPARRIGPEGLASPSILERVVADPARFDGTLFVITGSTIKPSDLERLDRLRDADADEGLFEPAGRELVLHDGQETLRRPSTRVLMFWFGASRPEVQGYINTVLVPANAPEAIYGVRDWRSLWRALEMNAPAKAEALRRDVDAIRRLCPAADARDDGWIGNAHELAAALQELGWPEEVAGPSSQAGVVGNEDRPRQSPATARTRYAAVKRPREGDGYQQRIPIYDAVERLGGANRTELLAELRRQRYRRPGRGALNEAYCRIELTDMTRRGYLKRVSD